MFIECFAQTIEATYQICLDMDGSATSIVGGTTVAKTFGFTGLTVYLSTAPRHLQRNEIYTKSIED